MKKLSEFLNESKYVGPKGGLNTKWSIARTVLDGSGQVHAGHIKKVGDKFHAIHPSGKVIAKVTTPGGARKALWKHYDKHDHPRHKYDYKGDKIDRG